MAELPPPVTESQFQALEGATKEQVRNRATPFVRELHSFLNRRSCLRDIQRSRLMWRSRVRSSRAFNDFTPEDEHWYTHNAGGRNEAQFNIGLFPSYLRIGMGFEATKKVGGAPEDVEAVYERFAGILEQYRQGFNKFIKGNSLQVEWLPRNERKLEYVPTDEVVEWLLHPPEPFPEWIFVGRLLYRGKDIEILEDPNRLRGVMETVFKGFIHPWEQAQTEAHQQ